MTAKPRIAIYHLLPPGGAKRAAYEQVRQTSDRFDYDFFTIDLGEADSFQENAGVQDIAELTDRTHRYPLGLSDRLPRQARGVGVRARVLQLERLLAADIDAGNYDALVVHHQQFTQAPTVLLHSATPSMYYAQEPRRASFEYSRRPRPRTANPTLAALQLPVLRSVDAAVRSIDTRATRAADLVLCNSYHSAEALWKCYGVEATVCRLGVDLDHFVPPPASTRRDPVVLAVGALSAFKDPMLTVEALGRVALTSRPELHLIGERVTTGYAEEVQRRADELGVKIERLTNLSDAELVQRYQRAQMTVCTARVEPFGLTPIESLACGTPVVAVREGGYRETVVDGVNGLLVDRDPAALAAAMERILDKSFHRSRKALRANVDPAYGWEQAGDAFAAQLERLLARR